MQISLKNVSYKTIKNINIDIEDNKITGIISNSIDELNDLNELIYENKKETGVIKYAFKYDKRKIGLVSIKQCINMISGNLKEFFLLKAKELNFNIDNLDEVLKNVGLSSSILKLDLSELSTSEKIKILFSITLLCNTDIILLDNIFSQLDYKSKDKIFKILTRLKFEHKTILISSLDIDLVYELIDNIVIIDNKNVLISSEKYSAFNDKKISSNKLIKKPLIVEITNKIYEKNNIKLGKNDNINELIKAIYREIR